MLVALLVVAGCLSGHDPDDVDSSEPATCAASTLTPVVGYDEAEGELPDQEDASHSDVGVAVGDLDGDGWLDALMAYNGGAMAMRNDGAGVLVRDDGITMDGGPLAPARGASMADVDADGDLDVLLLRDQGRPSLMLYNDGAAHFTSVTLDDPYASGSTASFADYDEDGDVDVYIATTTSDVDSARVLAGDITSGDGDRLFLQDAAGGWQRATDAIPADSWNGLTFQAASLDYDDDGDLDLYLAHDWGRYLMPNRLLRNDGGGRFSRAEDCACELEMYGMGAAVGDPDLDGRPDVYVTDIGGPNLLANLGDGTFVDATLALHADVPALSTHMTSWGAVYVDADMDGAMDLYVSFGRLNYDAQVGTVLGTEGMVDGDDQYDQLLHGSREGGFARREELGQDPGRKRSVAVGDLDRDGDPDFVTVGKYFVRQWRNDGGCGPGVEVRLHGRARDVHAIGARVEVDVAGSTTTQWMSPSSTGSVSAMELYFGLGTAERADDVRVFWPDGTEADLGPAERGSTVEADWR